MILQSPSLTILITELRMARRLNCSIFWKKYSYQRQNIQLSNLDAYAEDLGVTEVELLAYQNWINDGTPTGIESDEQFYDLQRQAYGEVVIELS